MGYKPQVEKDAGSLKRRIADARVALAKAETSRQVPPRQAALQEATLCGMTDYNCCFEAKRMLVDLLIKHDNQIKKAAAFRVSDMGPKERVLSSCRGKLGGGRGAPVYVSTWTRFSRTRTLPCTLTELCSTGQGFCSGRAFAMLAAFCWRRLDRWNLLELSLPPPSGLCRR